MLLFRILLTGHVIAGLVALVSFWAPVVLRKGSAQHRRWGRVFATALIVAGSLAIGMSLCTLADPVGTHPTATSSAADLALYRGLFGWMMLFLGILTIAMARHGLLSVRNARAHDRHRSVGSIALQVAVLVSAAQCGWTGYRIGQPLMIGVAVVGSITALIYLRFMLQRSPPRGAYLQQHLRAFIGAGISAYTAFLAVGLLRLMPAHVFNPLLWTVPSIVGVGLIVYHQLRAARPVRG